MTNAQKITKALGVFLKDGYTDSVYVFETLRKHGMFEREYFDTQYYFHDFYLSFTYYKNDLSSMALYTDRYSSHCPMICFERDGNIIVGKAMDGLNIYNGCAPSAQDMEIIGLDLSTFQYLVEIRKTVMPILANLSQRYLS